MFGKNDRSIGWGGMPLLIILFVVLAAAGGGYWRLRSARSQQTAPEIAIEESSSAAVSTTGERPLTLIVPAHDGLKAMQTSIPRQHEAQLEARSVIAALLAMGGSPASPLTACNLRGLYIDEKGTATVDLALPAGREARASAREELLAVYALVDTLTMNFPEIRRVRFLVNGKEEQTFAGHIDLARTYTRRIDLLIR